MRSAGRATAILALVLVACANPAAPSASPRSSSAPSTAPTTEPTPTVGTTGGPRHGQIAYVAGLEDPQIFLLDLATGESQQLTKLRPEDAELTGEGPLRPALSCGFGPWALAWSPDGSQLAFTYGACDTVVFVVSVEGELRRIGDGRAPTWSPDGSRLLYGANIPYQPCADCLPPPEPGDLELMVVDLAGGGDPVAFTADGSTSRGGQPTYSPDGTLVAFSGPPRDPDPGIFGATYLIGADGSEARLLADGAYPAGWLVDGRLLVTRERDSTVHAIDVASGESVQVGGDQSASVSPDGTRSLVWMSDPVTGAPGLQLWTSEGKLVGETLGTFGAWNPDSSTFAIFGNDSGLHVVSRDGELLASYEIGASGGTAAWRPGS